MNLFLGGLPRRYEEAEGPCKLEACRFTIDTEKKRCVEVRGRTSGSDAGGPAHFERPRKEWNHAESAPRADFHLDSPFSGLKPDAAARRRDEQRELLARLTDLAREREADLVLLSGDLLDGDLVFRETVQALARALGEIPCPVFLAPGNHDWYGPQSPYAALEWPGNVHLFTGPELGAVRLPELGCTVWGAAFCAPRRAPPPCGAFMPRREGVQLAVLHGEVAAQGTTGPISEEDIAASGLTTWPWAMSTSTAACAGQGETFWAYPGCPEGRGFDELGEKGVLWLEVEKGRTEAEFVPLCRRRYQILSVDLTGQADPAAAVLAALPTQTGEDIYRLLSPGSGD